MPIVHGLLVNFRASGWQSTSAVLMQTAGGLGKQSNRNKWWAHIGCGAGWSDNRYAT